MSTGMRWKYHTDVSFSAVPELPVPLEQKGWMENDISIIWLKDDGWEEGVREGWTSLLAFQVYYNRGEGECSTRHIMSSEEPKTRI